MTRFLPASRLRMHSRGLSRIAGGDKRPFSWPAVRNATLSSQTSSGHTNCGKSTLVNALSGIHPRRGPASTSDRAGWTDLVGFYQVGKKPPVLTLVSVCFGAPFSFS